ncbi:hypothetical protein GCM10009643_26870 [Microbacterium aurantiacum]
MFRLTPPVRAGAAGSKRHAHDKDRVTRAMTAGVVRVAAGLEVPALRRVRGRAAVRRHPHPGVVPHLPKA